MANLIDLFDVDSSADWVNQSGAYNRDAANGELDLGSIDHPAILRYGTPPGSMEHEAQVTNLVAAGRQVCAGCRIYSGANDCYGLHHMNPNSLILVRYNAGARTDLQTFTPTLATGDFVTVRLACAGGDGSNVAISIWVQNHGASKPADPGWIGVDDSPDYTYTDSAAGRLDDSAQHVSVGIAGRGAPTSGDSRHDYWRARAISDRAGGGGPALLPFRTTIGAIRVR